MMLDIDIVRLREGFLHYLPVGALIGSIMLIELLLVFGSGNIIAEMRPAISVEGGDMSGNMEGRMASHAVSPPNPSKPVNPAIVEGVSNTRLIGRVLYTDYIFYFQLAGAILLVSMIGSIVLTLQKQDNPKRQNIAGQNARTKNNSIRIVKVKSGQGL